MGRGSGQTVGEALVPKPYLIWDRAMFVGAVLSRAAWSFCDRPAVVCAASTGFDVLPPFWLRLGSTSARRDPLLVPWVEHGYPVPCRSHSGRV